MLAYIRKKIQQIALEHNRVDATVKLAGDCYVSGSTLSGEVRAGEGCRVFRAYVEGQVTLGRFTSLWGPGIHVIGRVEGVSVGSFCSIARYVSIQEDYHDSRRTTTYWIERNVFGDSTHPESMVSRGRIDVGNDVWIGAGSHILSGVTIGDGAVVGAGSVVTRDVPPFAVVAGNPAAVLRLRFSELEVARVLESRWWDWPIEKIRANRQFFSQMRT